MLPRKINTRSSSVRKQDLLSGLGPYSVAMRPYRSYSASAKVYQVGEGSKKYIEYIRLRKTYDLVISLTTLKKIYSKRV